MLEILSTLFESSAGSIQQSEFNIPPMWQRNFTSELSICWPFSRWVQVEVVCLHSQFTDGLCLELCLCIDEALFSNPPPTTLGRAGYVMITGCYLQEEYFSGTRCRSQIFSEA